MSTTSMAIFSNPLFATYSVYACNASFNHRKFITESIGERILMSGKYLA